MTDTTNPTADAGIVTRDYLVRYSDTGFMVVHRLRDRAVATLDGPRAIHLYTELNMEVLLHHEGFSVAAGRDRNTDIAQIIERSPLAFHHA